MQLKEINPDLLIAFAHSVDDAQESLIKDITKREITEYMISYVEKYYPGEYTEKDISEFLEGHLIGLFE